MGGCAEWDGCTWKSSLNKCAVTEECKGFNALTAAPTVPCEKPANGCGSKDTRNSCQKFNGCFWTGSRCKGQEGDCTYSPTRSPTGLCDLPPSLDCGTLSGKECNGYSACKKLDNGKCKIKGRCVTGSPTQAPVPTTLAPSRSPTELCTFPPSGDCRTESDSGKRCRSYSGCKFNRDKPRNKRCNYIKACQPPPTLNPTRSPSTPCTENDYPDGGCRTLTREECQGDNFPCCVWKIRDGRKNICKELSGFVPPTTAKPTMAPTLSPTPDCAAFDGDKAACCAGTQCDVGGGGGYCCDWRNNVGQQRCKNNWDPEDSSSCLNVAA